MIYKILAFVLLIFGTAHADTWTSTKRTVDASSGASMEFKDGTDVNASISGSTGILSTTQGGAIGRPSDFWTTNFYNVNNMGSIHHNGNFGVGLWSNGYRNDNGTPANTADDVWTSLAVSGNNGAAGVVVFPGGGTTFYNDSTHLTGASAQPNTSGGISNAGAWTIGPSGGGVTHTFNGPIDTTDPAITRANLELISGYLAAGTGETPVANLTSCSVAQIHYIRIGSRVHLTFRADLDPSATGVTATCRFDPPIPSAFTLSEDAMGPCVSTSDRSGALATSAENDDLIIFLYNTASTNNHVVRCSAIYIVKS